MKKENNVTMKIVDGFVWKLIDHRTTELLLDIGIFDIYQLYDDGSESNIPTFDAFKRAIRDDKNAQFAIEVGHINFDNIINMTQETVTIEPETNETIYSPH